MASTSTAALGWFVRFFLTANLVVVWIGYWLMSGQWPGSLKLWLCTVLGAASLVWSVVGRRGIRQGLTPTRTTRFMPVGTAIVVVGMIVVEAAFMTWVVWGPPFLG